MFSLRTLFLVAAVAALAAASLVANTFWLLSAFVGLTLGILCWSFLQREEKVWRGLCVFGTVYLLCAVVPVFDRVGDMLPSTRIFHALIDTDQNPYFRPLPDQFGEPPPPNPFRDEPEFWKGKRVVLHCVAALLFGAAGGLLLQWNAQRKKGGA